MAMPQTWSHVTFTELMKHSAKDAFEYRERTLGDLVPEKYRTSAKESAETVVELAENANEAGKAEFSEPSEGIESKNVETPVKKASKNAKKA